MEARNQAGASRGAYQSGNHPDEPRRIPRGSETHAADARGDAPKSGGSAEGDAEARFAELRKGRAEARKSKKLLVAEVEAAYDRYKLEVADTFKVAESRQKHRLQRRKWRALRKVACVKPSRCGEFAEEGTEIWRSSSINRVIAQSDAGDRRIQARLEPDDHGRIDRHRRRSAVRLPRRSVPASPSRCAASSACCSAWPRVKTSPSPAPSARTKSARPRGRSTTSKVMLAEKARIEAEQKANRIASPCSG